MIKIEVTRDGNRIQLKSEIKMNGTRLEGREDYKAVLRAMRETCDSLYVEAAMEDLEESGKLEEDE